MFRAEVHLWLTVVFGSWSERRVIVLALSVRPWLVLSCRILDLEKHQRANIQPRQCEDLPHLYRTRAVLLEPETVGRTATLQSSFQACCI